MSEWHHITPTRATTAPAVTPTVTSDISSHNYYGNLHDFESDTDSDRNQSHTDSESATNQDFWADEAIFWETARREYIQDPLDAEDEIAFSYCSSTTRDSPSPPPDSNDDVSLASASDYNTMSYDYKNVAEFMEIKKPGITTPISEPTTVQLLAFKKVLIR